MTDLTGFTAFADATEPEYVFETLGEYHGLVGETVEPLGGVVIDLAGDEILVAFNFLTEVSDGPQRAIRAALRIQQGSRALVSAWRDRDQHLGFRIALNGGFATLGHVRAGSHSEYRAVGSAVNAAFHLKRVARDGEILATQRIADAAGGLADPIPRPDISLDALVRKVRVFELRGP